ncbi:nitrate reductase [Luteimonas sp. BDR2-5]|uniref:dimethylarginine dimethylaminohydrolase family protein n=1 Tax=Proluteimonas luteida TaxID=2878685 RepID=UPI001E4C8C83|nr:arginine deiminase-related protein [Luteimonas sp. BDR2-5]MCD9028619.1 nitrate reductase [Luteimonas sp. BDR2-5]
MSHRPRILMCPPTHFAVDYVINPWMHGNQGSADPERARRQWQALVDVIATRATVECIEAGPGLPDMPFTANAGLVLGTTFVPSRFRHAERRGEEARFIDWFERRGFRVRTLPDTLAFEGAGDALLDRGQALLWLGHGHRSDAAAAPEIERMLGIETVPLQLVDPRFYHLDTCFCPLSGGGLMYCPDAFDAASRATIEARVPADLRLPMDDADALAFSCNAVDLGDLLVLHRASDGLRRRLGDAGHAVHEVPLDEFLKAGGSAKCLTLRLDEPAMSSLPERPAAHPRLSHR